MARVVLAALLVLAAACSAGDEGATDAEPAIAGTTVPDEPAPQAGLETSGSDLGAQPTPVDVGGSGLWSNEGVLASDPDCADPATGQPLRIGYAADFGELGAETDIAGSEAARHLVGLVNCAGGVAGQPLQLLVVDIGGSPLAGRAGLAELVDWEPHAIIGPRVVGPGLRVLQATAGRIPVVFPMSTAPALVDPARLSFLVGPDAGDLARAAGTYALDQGWQHAVTFADPGPDDAFGPLTLAATLEDGGGRVVGVFEAGQGGVESVAAELELLDPASQPDLIFAPMSPAQLSALAQDLGALVDLGGSDASEASEASEAPEASEAGIPVISADPAGPPHDPGAVASAVTALQLSPISPEQAGGSGQLDASFRAATGFGSANPTAAALAGDALAVIVEAYLRSGKGTSDEIGRTIAAGLTVEGVGGTIEYDGSGRALRPIHVIEGPAGDRKSVVVLEPRR